MYLLRKRDGVTIFTGKEIDAVAQNIIEPTKFSGRTTSDNGSPHTMNGRDWVDVVFVDVDFETQGDLQYDNGILTNIGVNTYEMAQDISCSIACNVKNVEITLAQWKSGVEDKGAQNVVNTESNTSKTPFSITAPFVLEPGDTLNLRLYADSASLVTIYHFSANLTVTKVILP